MTQSIQVDEILEDKGIKSAEKLPYLHGFFADVLWYAGLVFVLGMTALIAGLIFTNDIGSDGTRCATAQLLQVGQNVTGRVTTAKFSSSRLSDCRSIDDPAVWYKVEGTGNRMEANTCGDTTSVSFNEVISIYKGGCQNYLSQCVAFKNAYTSRCEKATWYSVPGETYYIAVAGYSAGDVGSFTLSILNA